MQRPTAKSPVRAQDRALVQQAQDRRNPEGAAIPAHPVPRPIPMSSPERHRTQELKSASQRLRDSDRLDNFSHGFAPAVKPGESQHGNANHAKDYQNPLPAHANRHFLPFADACMAG